MTETKEIPSRVEGPLLRLEFARAAALAVIVTLLWCTSYDRWTAESWQVPLSYLSGTPNVDALINLAWIKAAEDGHISAVFFNNIPELGAPNVANWDDFPLTEKPLIVSLGLLAHFTGIFAAANIAVLLSQVLAAVAFYSACRLLQGSWLGSFTGALVFALSRFSFAQGLHHLEVSFYWHVPLCLVVCEWLIRDGFQPGDRRFRFALVVAIITGVQSVYYTYIFVQLIFIGGLFRWYRFGWRQALPAVAIIATSASAFLFMNMDTFFYHLVHGTNPEALVRDYRWLEIYGLKLADMVVPPPDHPFPLFSAWGARYVGEAYLAVGEGPPSAYLGLLGLGALGYLIVASSRRAADRSVLPLEAFLLLWIILFSSVGGINGIIGTLGFHLIRSATRYSIVVLCIVLMFAVRRLTAVRFRSPGWAYGWALLAVIVAWWDQTPPRVTDHDVAILSGQVASDRDFTAKMKQRLPAGAMVFQLPIMDFPESPLNGVGTYDHFRPYFYAQGLRFSFGTDKGRPGDWQRQVARLAPAELVVQLERAGFAAIYINRDAFRNQGADLIKVFQAMGYTEIIDSERKDLSCLILKKP